MTAPKSIEKPAKPYPEYPLSPNNRGSWSKKWKGKVYSFGKWEDPQAALREWEEFRNKHELGEQPDGRVTVHTVRTMCKAFLSSKFLRYENGDLSGDSWAEYELFAKWLCTNIGEHRRLSSLRPDDFTKLRTKMPKDWAPTTVTKRVNIIRGIFKWAWENGLLDQPMRFGSDFSKPSEKKIRQHKRKQPKKFFDAKEVHTLCEAATPQLRAMILLGLNCGYGNSDCARLRLNDVQGAWLRVPRGKNENERKAWLWPETRKAISEAIKVRKEPAPGCEDLVFLTTRGQQWVVAATNERTKRDAVAAEFRDLKDYCGLHRKGVGFCAFRHVFETIGGETPGVSNLQDVINDVMGHVDEKMSGNYREFVSDDRVKKVCEYVRQWYLKDAPKRKRKKTSA